MMFLTRRNMRNTVLRIVKATQSAQTRSLTKTPISSENALNYCANLVKQHDYENFLATLLMTKALRSPALVIRAFNVEIARVQDQTTDPQTAMFRMQFWKDTLKDIYKKDQSLNHIPANPVAQELFKVCSIYKVPKRSLEKLIVSRENLMKNKYFMNLTDLEQYTDESVSSIYYSLLSLARVENVHADHAASHLGKAQGLANMLRSVQMSSQYKMVYLPMDVLMKHKVTQEDVLRCKDSEDMRNCIYEVASSANNHLKKIILSRVFLALFDENRSTPLQDIQLLVEQVTGSQPILKLGTPNFVVMARKIGVPKLANQIFLPATAVDSYLKRLQKCNFNVFDQSLAQRSPILPFSFYFKRLLNKY